MKNTNMKAQVVNLSVWDLDYLVDSKRKLLEKAFGQDTDVIVADLKKLGYGLADQIRVTVRKTDGTAGDLLYVQGMVNAGWKTLKMPVSMVPKSVIIWGKK